MATDSLRKASQHKPLGTKALWGTEGLQLPAYIQHIASALMRKRGMPKGRAIATARNAVRRWAAGGGDVDANTRAAAAKADAEWIAGRAKARATPDKSGGGRRRPRTGGSVAAAAARIDPLDLAVARDAFVEFLAVRAGTEHAHPAADRHGPLGPGTTPTTREVLMAVPPQFRNKNGSGSGPKKIASVGDVRKAVLSIKKLPTAMQPRAAARVVAAARQIGGEALSAVPTPWLKGTAKASGNGTGKAGKGAPRKGAPAKAGASS